MKVRRVNEWSGNSDAARNAEWCDKEMCHVSISVSIEAFDGTSVHSNQSKWEESPITLRTKKSKTEDRSII